MTAGSQPRVLYAANARVWAEEISRQTGRPAGLQDIADRQLDALRELGVDLLWLIGMWPTGPASTDTARRYPGLEADYRRALPDFTPADVAGSPYAIAGYGVDPQLGGESGLAALRARLHRRGIGLVLDFVVNHTGLDHPWLRDRPELYVQGNAQDLQRDPGGYFSIDTNAGPKVIAHGRDPYFPAWTDTAQLNLLLPATQDALTAELVKLAGQCDGVRCDMAMLALPSLFRQVWPAQQPAAESFWPGAIAAVRRRAEDFTFIAEVYWGREDELRQAGFRFTYDKTLHERLLHGDAGAVR